MSKMGSVSAEDKILAVKRYLSGYESQGKIAKDFGVHQSSFQKWIAKYKIEGEQGLYHRRKNKRYSEGIKKEAVEDYLSKKLTVVEICEKYEIRSRSQLECWILWYNKIKIKTEPKSKSKGAHNMPVKKAKKSKDINLPLEEKQLQKLKKLELENEKLKAKNEDLEMELTLRKKVKELKGGGR